MPASFWTTLPRPFAVLAPLAGVTDAAFRRVIAKYGKPAVLWTEFVSADGLCSPAGRAGLLPDLIRTDAERPLLAQLVGGKPENIRGAARLAAELGFDGVDINMGCPIREVEKRRAGAGLIRLPLLAREIIAAAQDGAGRLPVSVKTRLGYSQDETASWLPELIAAQPAAVSIHARTRDEMSAVPARWDAVAAAVRIAREIEPDDARRPLIIGNGDVRDLAHAEQRARESGCDGVMLGRAIFGNPWLFNEDVGRAELSAAQVLDVMLEHTAAYIEVLGARKPLELMKKHFRAYANGFTGAAELRPRLMAAKDYAELSATVREFTRIAVS